TLTYWTPAVCASALVYVVAGWSCHWSMTATPSTKTRTPSSARAVNVTLPPGNWKRPVQRAEKLSTGRPAGPPAPQSWLTALSHAVRVEGGPSAMLLKYSAKNWPVGQGTGPLTVKDRELDREVAGLLTVADAEPAVA